MISDKIKRMKSFKWEIPITWFDLVGYHDLPGRKRAKIELRRKNTVGEYECIRVKIFEIDLGRTVDSKTFYFTDYLEWARSPRVVMEGDKKILEYNDFKWIVEPTSTRPICEAIESWIEMYR